MPLVHVTFKVTAPDTCKYWLYIDTAYLDVINGTTAIDLATGQAHQLVFVMEGNGGDAATVVGTADSGEVVRKDTKIPMGKSQNAAVKGFNL